MNLEVFFEHINNSTGTENKNRKPANIANIDKVQYDLGFREDYGKWKDYDMKVMTLWCEDYSVPRHLT